MKNKKKTFKEVFNFDIYAKICSNVFTEWCHWVNSLIISRTPEFITDYVLWIELFVGGIVCKHIQIVNKLCMAHSHTKINYNQNSPLITTIDR